MSSLLPSLILQDRVISLFSYVPIAPIEQLLYSNCLFISSCLKNTVKVLEDMDNFFYLCISSICLPPTPTGIHSVHICVGESKEEKEGEDEG